MNIRPLLLIPVAVVAACSSTPTRYWTIEPASGGPSAADRTIAPVQVTMVRLPLALDRLELVDHDRKDRVTVSDFDRWSAPPGDLMRRALTQDLLARLPSGAVILPDDPVPAGARPIVVDVLDLRRDAAGFTMQVGWSISGTPTATHQLRLSAPAAAAGAGGQAGALAQMLNELSEEMAKQIDR